MQMEVEIVVQLVKERVGIRSSTARDAYITAIVNGVIDELQNEKGLTLSDTDNNHLMFIVDYSTWRYDNRDSKDAMPRHLQYRLHNLVINNKAVD